MERLNSTTWFGLRGKDTHLMIVWPQRRLTDTWTHTCTHRVLASGRITAGCPLELPLRTLRHALRDIIYADACSVHRETTELPDTLTDI